MPVMPADQKQSPSQFVANGRLAGKVAVITGGSGGIGFAIARTFAAEGANVIITGRDRQKLGSAAAQLSSTAKGGEVIAQACDVRDEGFVRALFSMVKARFGRLDMLVNSAGISHAPAPLEETSTELWRDMVDVNLTGLFLVTRAAVPLMQAGATIVNILSMAAKQIFPNYYAYTAAKMGAYGFTLSLRQELMSRGIRVTALIPGATDTELWQQIMPEAPRHHMVKVESVAQAVLYTVLLPPEADVSELQITPILGAV